MRKYYYDPKRYKTYLEQLGISYPIVDKTDKTCATATAASAGRGNAGEDRRR